MKSLPPTDPRSWTFQANIHWMKDTPTNSLFNSCKHDSNLFLAWHRGYLFYFERILQWASGDPSLMLPYWDWSNEKDLPEPYRQPASASNPLYEDGRALNDGSLLADAIVVDALATALDLPSFDNGDRTGFTWSLESSPHGAVHTAVGGIMAEVPTAANDPIFWLHHCNIDRLWDYWLNLGEGRTNLKDPAYLNTTFSYADWTGETMTHRIWDLIDSRKLGYRYRTVPNPPPSTFAVAMMSATMMAPVSAAMEAPQNTMQHQSQQAPAQVQAAPEAQPATSTPLGLIPVRTKATLSPRPMAVVAAPSMSPGALHAPVAAVSAPASAIPRVIVTVNDIEFEKIPEVGYGVYLNVPVGVDSPEAMRPHLIGVLNFFGKGDHESAKGHAGMMQGQAGVKKFSQSFDATNVAARLRTKGLYKDGESPDVLILPLTSKPPANAAAAEAARNRIDASSKEAKVRYRSVDVTPTF